MAPATFDSFPWDENRYYSPKEAGAFFGRGDDWARARFRSAPFVIHDQSERPRLTKRGRPNDSLLISGQALSWFARKNRGERAA